MPANLLLSMVLFAAQSTAQHAEQATPPDTELLEFLGSFETEEGEWVDPLVLAEVDIEAVEQQTKEAITPNDSEASQPVEDGGEQP